MFTYNLKDISYNFLVLTIDFLVLTRYSITEKGKKHYFTVKKCQIMLRIVK